MNNLCLVPFIGLPASGKSTTAIDLIKYCSNSGKFKEFRIFMLNFINRISAALRTDDYDYSNTIKLLMEHGIEWRNQSTTASKHSNICILIDDNHYYRSMRYEIYQLAKRYGTGFFQIYFKSSLENSIKRNLKRSTDHVPEEILVKMNIRLEPPNIKNHWEKYYCIVNIDENEMNFDKIYRMISEQTDNPEKVNLIPEITPNIPPTKIHQIDICLRKLINKHFKKNHTIYDPEELNEKRKHILSDLRAGIIEIPINLDDIQEYFKFNK